MKITLFTVGSRGDVQPYVALGKGLKAAGYEVRLATFVQFEEFVTHHGLEFFPVRGDPRAILGEQAGQRLLRAGENPLAFLRSFTELARQQAHTGIEDGYAACQGSQAVIYSTLGWFFCQPAVDRLGIAGLSAYLQPVSPTRAFPSFDFPYLPFLSRRYNLWTYAASQALGWALMRGAINQARQEVLGLPPMPKRSPFPDFHRQHKPIVYGYSEQVLPKPTDWGEWTYITGYWFLDLASGWQPPESLVDFLEGSPKPVAIGFGSMNDRETQASTRIVQEALQKTGLRAVMLSGWGGLGGAEPNDQVYPVEAVPHDWLFPRVAAAVVHGGAGTTAASLRAGLPTVCVPFFGDQMLWARCVQKAGVGPAPIHKRRLNAERLADALLVATQDKAMQARAAALGEKLRSERGVEKAVEVVGRLIGGP